MNTDLASWLDLAAAAFSGGLAVKALDFGFAELQRRTESRRSAKRFVDEHLDPLLKAADELAGKLRSLAERDFGELRGLDGSGEKLPLPLANLAFLFGRFWARIEILRQQSLYVELRRDKRGQRLMDFLDGLESQRIRLVDRAVQRAVGETLVHGEGAELGCVPFVRFVENHESEARVREWLRPLVGYLERTNHRFERQRLLVYGIVVHTLIDTLDPEHRVTKQRSSYPNKLTKRSKRDLRYRVFGVYAPYVQNQVKYVGDLK